MKNFNSFNTQPDNLEVKEDRFGNLTYDKAGTSLDNIVGELRTRHNRETTFVTTDNDEHEGSLQERLRGEWSTSSRLEPISSILKLDNNRYIVAHAGFMGLVKTNKENGEARLVDLIDMSDKDEDFNPYKGLTIGQPTNSGNTPVALTVFNRGNRSSSTTDNPEYQKFKKGLGRQITAYYENMK